jgi:hypothetical protein
MENPLKSDCFIGKLQSNCNRARLKNVSLKLGFIFIVDANILVTMKCPMFYSGEFRELT